MATFFPGYWTCPRCNGRDAYFAKRVTGMVGTSLDLSESPVQPGLARAIEQEVALCRECQERMNWVPEKTVYTPEEKYRQDLKSHKSRYWYLLGSLLFGFAGVILISDDGLGYKLAASIPLLFAITLFAVFISIIKEGSPDRNKYQ